MYHENARGAPRSRGRARFDRVRTRHAELLLLGGSLALGLLALEGWARWRLGRPKAGKERNERAAYTAFDATLGWVKRPGARVVYDRDEYTVEVAINSHGLRDPERDPAAPGRTRVLALGDSFIEGYSVALGDTVTQALEQRLRAGGCPVDVVNGGTGGYSTDQEYLFYREHGVAYDPRVVLLFFYYNDVVFNARRNYFGAPKPLLRPGDHGLAPVNVPLQPPRARQDKAGEAPLEEPPLASRSALLDYVRDRLMRGAPRAYNRLAALGLWPPLRGQEPADTLWTYALQRSAEMWRGWAVVRQVIEALRDDAARRGARLLVVYIPSRFEIDDGVWDLQRIAYSLEERGFDRRVVARRLSKITAAAGVDLLDLTSALARGHGRLTPTYFRLDGHWNARGHRVAALELERHLRERAWLPPCR